MNNLRRMLLTALLLAPIGVFSTAPAEAQECPRAPGVEEVPPPTVTAAQVEAGAGSLRDFALAILDYTTRPARNLDEASYVACLFRLRGGPFLSGSTYVINLSLDGRVFLNTNDMSTAGYLLNPVIYGTILSALGIDVTSAATIGAGLGQVAATGTFPNMNGGSFTAPIPGASGYAVGFISTLTRAPSILVVGYDLQESHLAPEIVDPGMPSITAAQVTNRATLKQFVDEAANFTKALVATGDASANSKIKIAFRDPTGPWSHGPTYLFMINDTGYTLFHGAFPNKYELQIPTTTLKDEVTGQLILPQIIATAKKPGGGFVTYHFDNPDDDSDSADIPKVTYAREIELQAMAPDGSTVTYSVIIGAGIYGDTDAVATYQDCPRPAGLAANPEETPSPTAGEVIDSGGGLLGAFAQEGRDYFNSITTIDELGYAGCITRNEGPWKSGPIYLSAVSLDGRVLFNAADMSTGGRPLNPLVYGAILSAIGIDVTSPATIGADLGQVAATGTFPRPDGGSVTGVGGYAVGYGTTIPYILVAGLNLHEFLLGAETHVSDEPEITAEEVVDRRSLKQFVEGAITYLVGVGQSNPTGALGITRSVLKRPPWRHDSVYLFMMDPNGYTHLHAGFPDRFEFQKPTETLRDEVTGDLILPQIIEVAQTSGGGFVTYYFDDPNDDSDSADVPKVTYAREVEFTANIPGHGPIISRYIVGAGIYGDPLSSESLASTKGWLAGFGRAVGSQAVEMISGRMNSPAPGGATMTLAGRTMNLNDDSEPLVANYGADLQSDRLAWSGQDTSGSYREMTLSQLLAGSSFHLSSSEGAEGEAGSHWSFWGRGARTSFEGGGDAAIEGDVETAMLGVDYEKEQTLTGVALSSASGDGGFENDGRSEIEASLTSVHPYLRYTVNERLSVWGILGFGQGEMTLDEKAIEKKVETDIEMRMSAFGFQRALDKVGDYDLLAKSDVLLTDMDADAKDGIEAISASANRFRLMLDVSREVALEGGGTMRPSIEAGLRHDGGDVDEGLGVEMGGGLRFTNPDRGLTVEVKARGLIAHEEAGVGDWGIGGMIRVSPGSAGRGLAFTVEPSMGVISSSAERLWGLQDVSRLVNGEVEDIDSRMRAEVGYGMSAWGGLLTPYAGLSVSEGGNGVYRLGSRFKMGENLNMSLDFDVRERVNDDPVNGIFLRGSVRW